MQTIEKFIISRSDEMHGGWPGKRISATAGGFRRCRTAPFIRNTAQPTGGIL